MKKTILTLLLITLTSLTNAQCDIKTNYREDGNVIKYFNPKPVVKLSEYEVGTSIYYNETNQTCSITLTVMFKSINPLNISGDLILQLSGTQKSVKLPIINSNPLQMNGREFAIALYKINSENMKLLKQYPLKGIYFKMGNKTHGSIISENKTLLINQFKCLKK